MIKLLYIAAGGALGSVMRYNVGRWATALLGANGFLPWGTLSVNVIGSFLIGLCLHIIPRDHAFGLFIVTGVLGGFTTFSAFSVESLTLLKSPHPAQGIIYIALSIFLSLGAVYLGTQIKNHV